MEYIIDEHGCAITIFKGVRGTLNSRDVDTIVKYASALSDQSKYIETGSYLGCSALIVASHSHALVYAHDIWVADWSELKGGPPPRVDDYFYKFYTMVQDNNLEQRIFPIRGSSPYTVGIHRNESIDMCFIDGDHSYEGCYADLKAVFPKMKIGGIVLIHDCARDSDTLKAVLDFTRENDISFDTIDGSCGMIVFKK
jgi:hypothetical protein